MNILLICNYKPGVGGISGQVEILQRMLRQDGHEAEIFSTKGSVLWRLGLMRRLRQSAQEYDVLHVHCCSNWGFLPAVVGVTIGHKMGKRVILTYHGGGGEKFFEKHPRLVKHYLTHTDANIVLSGFLGKVFDQHQLPYTIIPNILEFDESQYRERTEIKPHFICTRAHEPLYNIPCILRAFQTVINKIPESTLTLIGDGSEHENLIQLSQELNLKNVTFTGRVDNSEIYHYLDNSDILLSAPTVDNMPVSILEAMNAGLLVISSHVGGVPYMLKKNSTGLLFNSDDDAELAKLMLWAVSNQNVALTIARQAHRSVNQYRWESVKDQLYSIYGIHT